MMLNRTKCWLLAVGVLLLAAGVCRADEDAATVVTVTLGTSYGSSYGSWYTTTHDANAEDESEKSPQVIEAERAAKKAKQEAERLRARLADFASRFRYSERAVIRDLLRGSGPQFDWVMQQIIGLESEAQRADYRCVLLSESKTLRTLARQARTRALRHVDALALWLIELKKRSSLIWASPFNRCVLESIYAFHPERLQMQLTETHEGLQFDWVAQYYMGVEQAEMDTVKDRFLAEKASLHAAFLSIEKAETRTTGFNELESVLAVIASKLQVQLPKRLQPSTKPIAAVDPNDLPGFEDIMEGRPLLPMSLRLTLATGTIARVGIAIRAQRTYPEVDFGFSPSHISLGLRQYGFEGDHTAVYLGAGGHLFPQRRHFTYDNPTESDLNNTSNPDAALSVSYGLRLNLNFTYVTLGHTIYLFESASGSQLFQSVNSFGFAFGYEL